MTQMNVIAPFPTDQIQSFSRLKDNFFSSKIEISRLNSSNTNCMENMAWVIKDLWYIFSSTIANKYFPLELHVELMLTVTVLIFPC